MTKMIQVDLDAQIGDQNEAQEWANEIVNVYADMEVANVNVSGNKISFQAGFSGMDDTTTDDMQQKIEEYASMTEIFPINKISCK